MLLPDSFTHRMMQILGDQYDFFRQSLEDDAKTSIRINQNKYSGIPRLNRVDYCSTGYFVPERPRFTLDPFIHAGAYYVQESSSMFLEQAVKQCGLAGDICALDLCAAPGGKSTHLLSLLPTESLLVSNEVIRSRAQILSENIKKWGNANVVVSNNDPHDFQRLPQFFDLIVIDAPCSGEGLFRRDENAVNEWSTDNAALCAQRQQRVVADVWPTLKNGGILIYSTCTFNPAENEQNIEWLSSFAEIEPVELKIDENWGITQTDAAGFPCYRFYPHRAMGEGFFMAVVRKKGEIEMSRKRKIKENPLQSLKVDKELARPYLNNTEMEILRYEESLLAFPSHWVTELLQIKNNLRIIHAGVKIGDIKQKTLLPAHELALSGILNREYFPFIDLSLEESIRYLKRDELQIRSDQMGWNLVTYRDLPLGWVKNLGNRMNSAFPKEWRIRMSVSEFQGEQLQLESLKFPL